MKIVVKKSELEQSVSISNDLIEKYHFENEAELVLQPNGILIKSVERIREGGLRLLKKMLFIQKAIGIMLNLQRSKMI